MNAIKTTWSKVIYAGTSDLPDHDSRKHIVIGVNKMALSAGLINASIGILAYFFTNSLTLLSGVLSEIVLMSLPIILNYQHKYNSGKITLYLIASAATCYFCCILGQLAEAQLTIIYLVGAAMFFFEDKKSRLFCIGIAILTLVLAESNFKWEVIHPLHVKENVEYFLRASSYSVIIYLVVFTFDLFRKSNQELLVKVQQYNSDIQKDLKVKEEENKVKDKFISNASHEMRVSFYSIFSIINLIRRQERNLKVREEVNDLTSACKYSESIIENILASERYKAGISPPVLDQLIDVTYVLNGIVEIYKYQAEERRVKIRVNISDNITGHIVCDEMKLRQIINNLLHNAIKFTKADSIIDVEVDKVDNNLKILVSDRGEGIHPDNLPHIFDPFFTKNPHGLGLGLYIVKELVGALKGKIGVLNNQDGEGVTFSIYLPLHSKVQHTSQVLSLT